MAPLNLLGIFSLNGLMYLATILSLCFSVQASAISRQVQESANPTQRINKMVAGLGPKLSPNATIYFEGSQEFDVLTERWQLYAPPNFIAVVDVQTEADVQKTVQLANLFGLPWLAISGHHGSINSLGTFKCGIQISMEKLNKIQISPDGQTALIGGGTLSKNITDTLWVHGKQTVTGACECTSLVGPMLGGGHGWLQGQYGLSADQLVEAQVVLANGDLVIVSNTSHPDLFWALKGAGHNFGIMTQVKYKIHDVPNNGTWTYAAIIFTQDKLEQVFGVVNNISDNGEGPIEYIDFVWYQRLPDIDAEDPVVSVYMVYQGTRQEAQPYIDMYLSLGPANTSIIDTDYTQISSLTGIRFPSSVVTHNLTTNRLLYNKFANVTAQQPGLNNSFYLFEDYSTESVEAVDPATTAFPDRFNHHLTSPVLIYFDSALDDEAIKAGQELREIALEGKSGPLNAYVNYAHGDETLEDWYGHESWRIAKLRSLKRKYDPYNRFGYYAPIEV